MHRLRSLLHSRGTLCSDSFPCTVTAAPGGRNHTVQVCLPRLSAGGGTLCQASPMDPSTKGWFLIKACARGAGRRCFTFDTGAIMHYYGELRQIVARIRSRRHEQHVLQKKGGQGTSTEPQSLGPRLRQQLDRCALAMSGHSLRCGLRMWAPLIDNRSYYAAVFRANNYRQPVNVTRYRYRLNTSVSVPAVNMAGSRTDFAYHNCESAPKGASCVEDAWLESSTIMSTRRQLWPSTGLGAMTSGGTLTDLAIASCKRVDVFGAGMFSRGPGNDVVYQHYYDAGLTPHCRAPCLSAVASRLGGRVSIAEAGISRLICSPKSDCGAIRDCGIRDCSVAKRMASQIATSRTLPSSEVPDNFYFRAELRLHVLHALGELNWVWY